MREGVVKSFDGVEIAFSEGGWGKTAVVLIHGWSCDRTYWAGQVAALAADHRVVLPDLAGHGKSGGDREPWSIASFGHDVAAVVRRLALERVVLVGHSMGGLAALEAAPPLEGRAIGAVTVDTLHDADRGHDVAWWRKLAKRLEDDFPATCKRMVRTMFRSDADPAIVARVAAAMGAARPEIGAELIRLLPIYDEAGALSRAGVPIRAINAPGYPTNVEANRKHAADYEALIMQGVGHFPMFDRPAEFNRLLAGIVAELAAG